MRSDWKADADLLAKTEEIGHPGVSDGLTFFRAFCGRHDQDQVGRSARAARTLYTSTYLNFITLIAATIYFLSYPHGVGLG